MPALKNVKWERFCQAIVNGVAKQGQKFSQGKAYISAGYNAKGVGEQEDQPKSAPPNQRNSRSLILDFFFFEIGSGGTPPNGGRLDLQSTACYIALAPDRFAKFWKD